MFIHLSYCSIILNKISVLANQQLSLVHLKHEISPSFNQIFRKNVQFPPTQIMTTFTRTSTFPNNYMKIPAMMSFINFATIFVKGNDYWNHFQDEVASLSKKSLFEWQKWDIKKHKKLSYKKWINKLYRSIIMKSENRNFMTMKIQLLLEDLDIDNINI